MAQATEILKDAGGRQYLVFSLRGEAYAIPLLGVKEIIEYGGITAIPTMPPFIRGVINLRGRVVPVLDLAVRFGEIGAQLGPRACIVIVEQNRDGREQDMGVVVDSVNAVQDIADADIEPPPSFGTRIRGDFIQGMWNYQGRFVIVLNLSKVLSIEEIAHMAAELQDRP